MEAIIETVAKTVKTTKTPKATKAKKGGQQAWPWPKSVETVEVVEAQIEAELHALLDAELALEIELEPEMEARLDELSIDEDIPAKPEVPAKVPKATIASMTRDLIITCPELSNKQILEAIKAVFEDCKTSYACVAWYRSKLRKEGAIGPRVYTKKAV